MDKKMVETIIIKQNDKDHSPFVALNLSPSYHHVMIQCRNNDSFTSVIVRLDDLKEAVNKL